MIKVSTLIVILSKLFSLIAAFSFIDFNKPECSSKTKLEVPDRFNFSRSDEYKFSDGSLQIFSQLKVPCDGLIVEWRFKTLNPIIEGLNIALFRQRIFEPIFDLVGYSAVDKMATPNQLKNVWVKFRPQIPLVAKAGDCLGIFYTDAKTPGSKMSLAIREDFGIIPLDALPTYVLFSDGAELNVTRKVDVLTAIQTLRDPALVAVMELPGGYFVKKLTTPQPPSAPPAPAWAANFDPEIAPQLYHSPPKRLSKRCFFTPRGTENFCWRPRWRFYYEVETKTCRQFFGCRSIEPVANNFDTRADCSFHCPKDEPTVFFYDNRPNYANFENSPTLTMKVRDEAWGGNGFHYHPYHRHHHHHQPGFQPHHSYYPTINHNYWHAPFYPPSSESQAIDDNFDIAFEEQPDEAGENGIGNEFYQTFWKEEAIKNDQL